jgi:hypothetical protein
LELRFGDFTPRIAIRRFHIADYGVLMTDRRSIAKRQLTPSARDLSQELFGRPHQLEVAAAAARLEPTFSFEEAYEEARSTALSAGLEPPGRSAVRTNLQRLARAGALTQVLGTRTGEKHAWVRAESSSFWTWLAQAWPGAG